MTISHIERLERERDAKICKRAADKAETSPTFENIEEAEHATDWFYKKHGDTWAKYLPQERGIE